MRSLLRMLTALAAVALFGVIASGPALADSVSMWASPGTIAADGTATSTVSAEAPVMERGIIQQQIVQEFDPSKLRVTGTSGITAPEGWTLSFSADGTTFGPAPNTNAGWDAIRAVKAVGPVLSEGEYNGRQVVSGTTTAQTPVAGSFTSPAGAGDGWDVAFDDRGHVFNRFHHALWGAGKVDCHKRDGSSCGAGWPFTDGMSATDESSLWVDTANQKVWFMASKARAYDPANNNLPVVNGQADAGFGCIDISTIATPRLCGGSMASAWHPIATGSYDQAYEWRAVSEMTAVGGKLFGWLKKPGQLLCFDTTANGGAGAPCAGQPYTFPPINYGWFLRSTVKVSEGLLYASAMSADQTDTPTAYYGVCFDPVALTPCPGWEQPKTLTNPAHTIYELPTPAGDVQGVCFEDRTPGQVVPQCFARNGRSITPNQTLANYIDGLTTWDGMWVATNPTTVGSRLYWGNGSFYLPGTNQGNPQGTSPRPALYCFDVATNALCSGWPILDVENYTLVPDPENYNCFWKNTDTGVISAYDATGAVGCSSPPPWADIEARTTVPRMACEASGSLTSWRSLTLGAPSARTYSSAYLTVYRADGRVVESGGIRWANIPIPAGSRTVDLSAMAVADSGISPTFRVGLKGRTTSDDITVAIAAAGDAPQFCVPLQAEKACPASPARIPDGTALPTPSPAVVNGRGSATYEDYTVEQFTAGSTQIALQAPSAPDCLGTISGTAATSGGGILAVGVPVVLKDAQGTVIASTTTDASGNYAFTRLVAGSGYRVEFGDVAGYDTTTATDQSATANRTVTAGQATDVDGVYVTASWAPDRSATIEAGATAVFSPFAASGGQSGATPSGGSSYTSGAKALTRLCALAETAPACTLTARYVPGEGTWTVSADGTSISFIPLATFAGVATPVDYSVTDAAGTKASGTLSPSVIAGAATDDTGTVAKGGTLNSSVASNDDTGPSYGYVVTRQPSNGTLTLNADGTYTYVPNAGFTGQDTFEYAASAAVCPGGGSLSAVSGASADFKAVTGSVAVLDRAPAADGNLVVNGDFDIKPTVDRNGNAITGNNFWFGPTATAAGMASIGIAAGPQPFAAIPGWTATGGGTGTYAAVGVNPGGIDAAGGGASNRSAYLGNYWDWSTSPWPMTFDANGLSRTARSFATSSTVNGAQNGSTPLTLSQSITTVPGTTYRLQFALLSENSSFDGVAAFEVTGYGRTYMRVGADPRRVTIEFVATQSSTQVSFLNWGHVKQNLGDLQGSHEMGLDDVIVNECPKGPPVTATATINVNGPATLSPDAPTGAWDTNQLINPLTNDLPALAPGVTLDPQTVRICAPGTAATACTGTSYSVQGEGTYTVNPSTGVVTFDPDPGFTGQASGVTYVVTDSLGQKSTSTIRPVVDPPGLPVPGADTSSGPMGVAQTRNLLANDIPTGAALQTSSIRLCDPTADPAEEAPNCTATQVTVAGVGTYVLNTGTGVVTFTPDPGYSGTPAALGYQVTDVLGRTMSSTYTPTVIPAPTAVPDTSTGTWDVDQVITPLANDTAAGGLTLDPTSVRICAAGTPAGQCTGTTLTVANEGTYSVNPTTGAVVFDPLPTFIGQATAIGYVVEDSLGQTSTSTIQPTVTQSPPPVATPDQQAVLPGQSVDFTPVVGNGALASGAGLQTGAGSGPCLINPANPGSCSTSVSIPGEGTWSIDQQTGVARFTASAGLSAGPKTPVDYRVTDRFGQVATSTLTPVVPGPPSAAPDQSAGIVGATQRTSLVANDAASPGVQLVPTSVRLCPDPTPTPINASTCALTTLAIQGEGTYSVVTSGTSAGTVVFTPEAQYVGTAAPRAYVVADSLGQVTTSTYTPEVVDIPAPVAAPDTSLGAAGVPQSVLPLVNDAAGDARFPLSAPTVRLCGPADTPPTCRRNSVNTADGLYEVDALTGRITFTPADGFVGEAEPVTYVVTDGAGQRTWSTYTPTVVSTGPPVVSPASVSVPYGVPGTMTPVVTAGTAQIDPAKSCLAASASVMAGAPCAPGDTVLTRPEGTYVLDPATGIVTFTPSPGFTGTPSDPPVMCVTDAAGQFGCATLTPTVGPPPPAPTASAPSPFDAAPFALPEVKSAPAGKPAVVSILGNDRASAGATLVPSTVRIQDPRTRRWVTSVVVPGEGTWQVNDDGTLTFSPVPGFTGRASDIAYRVTDTSGKTAESTATVIMRTDPPPWADPDFGQTPQGQPVVLDPLAGDNPGDARWVTSSLRIRDPRTGAWTTRVTIPGQGTYVVNRQTGKVTFTPLRNFVGAATPVAYRARTTAGKTARSTLNPVIRGSGPHLQIRTTASKPVLRVGQRTNVTLRVFNPGVAAARQTWTRAPIPRGFAVANPRGGVVRGGWIWFRTGNLLPGATRARTFTLVATQATGRRSMVMGRSSGSNVRPVKDPTALRVIGSPAPRTAVTG